MSQRLRLVGLLRLQKRTDKCHVVCADLNRNPATNERQTSTHHTMPSISESPTPHRLLGFVSIRLRYMIGRSCPSCTWPKTPPIAVRGVKCENEGRPKFGYANT